MSMEDMSQIVFWDEPLKTSNFTTLLLVRFRGLRRSYNIGPSSRYFLLTPTALQTRTPTWMSKFMPHDNTVFLKDVSSMLSCIQLIGPKACSVISELAHCDMTMKTFRFKVSDFHG